METMVMYCMQGSEYTSLFSTNNNFEFIGQFQNDG